MVQGKIRSEDADIVRRGKTGMYRRMAVPLR